MRITLNVLFCMIAAVLVSPSYALAADAANGDGCENCTDTPATVTDGGKSGIVDADKLEVKDPWGGMNRAFFGFNNVFQKGLAIPLAKGYSAVTPKLMRKGFKNFFANIGMPRRLVNCLLQGKVKGAGVELGRFGMNTVFGLAGFMDPAKDYYDIQPRNEDFGQTLACWNFCPGPYVQWPFFGPSNVRDTIGALPDLALDPVRYLPCIPELSVSVVRAVNNESYYVTPYQELMMKSGHPYVTQRNQYILKRREECAK